MAEHRKEEVETAPDPDEDDLDDLDDVLDQFHPKTAPKPEASTTATTTAPTASGPGRPSQDAPGGLPGGPATAGGVDDAAMADMLKELDSNPEMTKQLEAMLMEMMQGQGPPMDGAAGVPPSTAGAAAQPATSAAQGSTKSSASASAAGKEENFQDTIRKTMERMQASGESASAAASSSANAPSAEDAMLAEMMKQLGAGGEGGEGDFNSMLMSMMTQLTNKEILYEPMKELHDKFPRWMDENKDKVSQEDRKRYEEQQKLVGEIVGKFERPGYTDENEADREYIVERMQKMQAAGSPPPDLVGDMNAAQEALEGMDAGCPTQ
ncbi:hypothetical protein MBLNU230_g1504t1 [Neophaeotheca triangularis]